MRHLTELNACSLGEFVAELGGIFEHSPWIAERAAAARPFASRLDLLDGLRNAVAAAAADEHMRLIRAHPQLGVRGRIRAQLTQASSKEQRTAGLDACTPAQLARLDTLNAAYVAKFAMPFILAVRGHDPASILDAIERRLAQDPATECRTALAQIGRIAAFRLAEAVTSPVGAEVLAMQQRLQRVAGVAHATADLLREWLLAAGLEVSGGDDWLLGRLSAAEEDGRCLLLGVHYDTVSGRVRLDGCVDYLVALATAARCKTRGRQLRVELCMVARPHVPCAEEGGGVATDTVCGCIGLLGLTDAAFGVDPDLGRTLRSLAPVPQLLLPACRGPAGIVYRPAAAHTAATLERAVDVLEDFLLQAENAVEYNA